MSSKCAAQHGYAYKVARYSFGNRSSIIHKIAFVWISTLESLVFTCTATQWAHPVHEIHHRSGGGGEGGKGAMASPRKSVVQSACHYDVKSRVGDFQNGEQSVHRRDGYKFRIVTAILFWFLGPGDFKIPIVIEKQTLVLFWNETSSGVMNFKISFYRLAYFTGNQTDRSHFLGPVHSKMKECWHSNRRFIKWYIILYIVCTFNSSEPVEPHINPFKVRLAGSVERRR